MVACTKYRPVFQGMPHLKTLILNWFSEPIQYQVSYDAITNQPYFKHFSNPLSTC